MEYEEEDYKKIEQYIGEQRHIKYTNGDLQGQTSNNLQKAQSAGSQLTNTENHQASSTQQDHNQMQSSSFINKSNTNGNTRIDQDNNEVRNLNHDSSIIENCNIHQYSELADSELECQRGRTNLTEQAPIVDTSGNFTNDRVSNLNDVFQISFMNISAHMIFEKQQVRLISVISPSFVLVACQERSYERREFKIIKIKYGCDQDQKTRPIIHRTLKQQVGFEIVCELSKSFKNITKEIQCARLVKHDNYIAILHDTSQIIIIQEQLEKDSQISGLKNNYRWIEIARYDCQNRMLNASITPVSLVKGYFIMIGSKIQLFQIYQDSKDLINNTATLQLKGTIQQVLGGQYMPHACQVIKSSKLTKIDIVFQIQDRTSQELQQVQLDFKKGRFIQKLLVPGLIGSATKLSANKNNFQVVLLEAKVDKIISYDIKRHAPVKLIVLPKAFSILINNSYFPLYKLINYNVHYIYLVLSDNNVVVNLENLQKSEDKEQIDLNKHNHSQMDQISTRNSKGASTDLTYGIGTLHDLKVKPQRTIMYIWAMCSYLDHCQDYIQSA